MRWAYGVTTVAERLGDYLPATLRSLDQGGFPKPRLFVDGVSPEEWSLRSDGLNQYEVTLRHPKIRTMGNWALGLAELYLRDPKADRYAMFQDDILVYRNLCQYLMQVAYQEEAYWNLYCVPQNEDLVPSGYEGFYPSNQKGRGALALVFSRKALTTLLCQSHFVERPLDVMRGWRSIDGGIVTSLAKGGYKELVHYPSLVQHNGVESTMANAYPKPANSFRGEIFDALELIKK